MAAEHKEGFINRQLVLFERCFFPLRDITSRQSLVI